MRAFAQERGGALGAPDIHKAIWQVIIPPSCPVGRKTKAFLLNLSMPTHTGMTPAGFQVAEQFHCVGPSYC